MSSILDRIRSLFSPSEYKSDDPLDDLRRSIIANLPEETCAKAAKRCLHDPRIRAQLVDPALSRLRGTECLRQAGLHQLVTKDERFDDWRTKNQERRDYFVRKVIRIRNLLPEHLHEI